MGTIFDNFDGTVDLSVFSKKNPDPKTSLRRHYLSLVGLLQYVDIMNGDAEGSLPTGWNENTIAGMLNHCIGDLDTRMVAISPSPVPEPEPKGWRSDDPIVCTGKDLAGWEENSALYQYYFYFATSNYEKIKKETTYLAIDKNKVAEFNKNNVHLDEDIQKMEQLGTLTLNAYYFAINTEVIYLAVDTKTLKQIERTPINK